MKNRLSRVLALLVLVCVMVSIAIPLASAASYSKVYGKTQARIRVRESASTNATIIDNIVDKACVYVTSSKTSGSSTFVQIKYRNADGDIATGWACQNDGSDTYIKILSATQADDAFGVKGGDLPSKKVGTFTAAERKASQSDSDNSYIKLDSTGPAVKAMQTKLKKLGYYSADETGKAGKKTVAAIKDFQSKNGLTADGVAGPATLAKIDAAYDKLTTGSGSASGAASSGSGLRLNSTGADVRDLQTDLTTLGFYWATISGSFGEKTETAVKRFQEENGLTVDGVAGKKTLDAIAAAIAAKGGTSSSTSSTTGNVLKLNSQGTKVSQLQEDLRQLGYYYAQTTGNFGDKTEEAVKEFQKRNGLTADGVAGAKTLAAIAAKVEEAGGSLSDTSTSGSGLKLGMTSNEVEALQKNLTTLGFYYGDVTKHFGPLTQQAVKKFQKSRGLTQDGVAGAKTLAAIESAVKGTGNTPAGSTSGSDSLRRGDTNDNRISDMQTRLKALGYYYGQVTGSFGELTEKAVKKFQDDNNLTVDGIAGRDTLNKLYSLTGGTTSTPSGGSAAGTTVSAENSFGRITKNNVYLRAGASTSSASKASLGNGTLVRISKVYTDKDGAKWNYISVKFGSYTHTGYVRADMMTTITEAEYNGAGGSSNTDFDQETLGMILVTGNGVRLRYSPSTDAEKVGEANKGDVFYYVNSVSGWFQTKAGYWISSSYARVMTSKEVDDYAGGAGSSTTVSSTYRYGDTGSEVRQIQTMLVQLGYSINVGGFFGYNTEAAVKDFQRNNNLGVDGVVGKKTYDKIVEAYNNSLKGTGGTTTVGQVVYNISWKTQKDKVFKNLGLERGKNIQIMDYATGKTFTAYVQSTGNHADLEPLTAADTAVMCSIYGVTHESQINYRRRAVIVTIGTEQFVGSMYGESHGTDTIGNNNYEGQFCVHFKDSTIHSGDGGSVPDSENHQAVIADTVAKLKAAGVDVKDTYVTSQQP